MKIRAGGGRFRAGRGNFRAAGCSPLLFLFMGNTTLTLDLMVDLQHKCLQHLHLLALHLEIEGYTTLLLYLLLEFLSTGDLRGER